MHTSFVSIKCLMLARNNADVQDTNTVDFEPALQSIHEVLNVSYGLRSFDCDSYWKNGVISIVNNMQGSHSSTCTAVTFSELEDPESSIMHDSVCAKKYHVCQTDTQGLASTWELLATSS